MVSNLYIHIPWCIKKCPYCDFNSHQSDRYYDKNKRLPEQAYLQALLRDLDQETSRAENVLFETVFIGGGTPSLVSDSFYQQLFDSLRLRGLLAGNAEVTMEANPGAIDAKSFHGFRRAGINRISLGAQSFSNEQLRKLGRVHDAESISKAFITARSAGFNNINIDIMYGLEQQTIAEAADDLRCAIDLKPDHLSWYQLTIEPNTVFYSQPPQTPDDDEIFEIHKMGAALLAANGFQQYEVSAYARERRRAAHNINYWEFGDYIGVGAGAHGKVTYRGGNDLSVTRRWKTRMPDSYIESIQPLSGENKLSKNDLITEFMLNALRLKDGFSVTLFENQTGLNANCLQPSIDHAIKKGLLSVEKRLQANRADATIEEIWLQPTELGYLHLNSLMLLFMPD